MQANRKIHLCQQKSTHLHVVSQHITKMQQIWCYRHMKKTSGLFLWHRMGVDFSSRNKVSHLGSLAKISIPVETIIPWSVSLFLKRKITNTFNTNSTSTRLILNWGDVSFTCPAGLFFWGTGSIMTRSSSWRHHGFFTNPINQKKELWEALFIRYLLKTEIQNK